MTAVAVPPGSYESTYAAIIASQLTLDGEDGFSYVMEYDVLLDVSAETDCLPIEIRGYVPGAVAGNRCPWKAKLIRFADNIARYHVEPVL